MGLTQDVWIACVGPSSVCLFVRCLFRDHILKTKRVDPYATTRPTLCSEKATSVFLHKSYTYQPIEVKTSGNITERIANLYI